MNVRANEPKVKEKGSIFCRRGITTSCPAGTGWEYIIGVRMELFLQMELLDFLSSDYRAGGISFATEDMTFHFLTNFFFKVRT